MFNLLCERADNKYNGRLPHHVRVLWDEAANTGQVPQLEKLVAVIRSCEISLCLFLQAQSQLKALYKDNAETIMGNMDSVIFLGGREHTTVKKLSEALGKETISMYTKSMTRGVQQNHGQNLQRLGKELMTTDEMTTMDGSKCILQLRDLRANSVFLEPPPRYNRATGAPVESHLSGTRRFCLSVVWGLRADCFAHGSVALHDDLVCLSTEAVGYRLGGDRDRNLVQPFGGLELGRDDRSFMVVPPVDEPEQYLRLLYEDRKQKPFVYDQEIVLYKLLSRAIKGFNALGFGFQKLVQQIGQLYVSCFQKASACGLAESLGQERLSATRRSGKNDVACVRNVVARCEFQNEVAVELPIVVVPDVLDAGGRVLEFGRADEALQRSELVTQAQHAEAGAVGLLLDNRPVENGFDHPSGGSIDFVRPAQEAVAIPVDEEELVGRHMLRDGRIIALSPEPFMRRDPPMLIEYSHCRLRCSNVDIFSQVFERNGVEFTLTENVTVHLDLGFPPLSQFVGGFEKREQELFFFGEKGCPTALALPGQGGGVDMFQSCADVLLQIVEG